MKVLLLSTNDIKGGAARAAYHLHQGLQAIDVDSQMLVKNKTSDDRTVISSQTRLEQGWRKIRPILDAFPLQLYKERQHVDYHVPWLPSKLNSTIESLFPNIINLHWICSGYFSIEEIAKFNQPIVWTLHDMWAFTGGCHYSQECDRYTESCGKCPILKSNDNWDLSRWLWQRKAKAWHDLNLTIVTPSKWLAECAAASSLFQDLPIEIIPNGLNLDRYKPIEKKLAKQIIGLETDKKIVLFGAMSAASDLRKGFHLLMPALQELKRCQTAQSIELVIFGASQPNEIPDFGFEARYVGILSDDISIALLYSAADVFIAPSIQDNLPNTVMEALACGTPCVAFDIGGMPELIDHKQNGYLAEPLKPRDLAAGIAWILEDRMRYRKLAQAARDKAERCFSLEMQARKYARVFESLLDRQS
jgi:glycosyltransferase involved in cell wall biosynthesis